MTKNKIQFACFLTGIVILIFVVAIFFIPINISSNSLLIIKDSISYISFNKTNYSYIENNHIQNIKIIYDNQKYNCKIEYYQNQNYDFIYYIILPPVIYKNNNYLWTNVIIDTINFSSYLFL